MPTSSRGQAAGRDPDVDLNRGVRRPAASDADRDLTALRLPHPGGLRAAPPIASAAHLDDPGLFLIGVVFAWYLVVPPAINFLVGYNSGAFNYQLRAKEYVQFLLLTMLAMGIVFEMLAVMLILARLRIMSSALMRRHWRVSIVMLAVVAMLLPGVDPVASWSSSSRYSASTGSRTSSYSASNAAAGPLPAADPS